MIHAGKAWGRTARFAAMTQKPELAPLGVGQVIDTGLRIIIRRYPTMAAIALVFLASWRILRELTIYWMAESLIMVRDGPAYFFSSQDTLDLSNVIDVVIRIASVVGMGLGIAAVVAVAAADRVGAEPIGFWESVRVASRRTGSLLWIGFLVVVFFIIGAFGLAFASAVFPPLLLFAAIPLAVYMLVLWSVAIPALMIEDERGVAALDRSRKLVNGRWWATFGSLLIALVVLVAVQLGFGALVVGVFELDNAPLIIVLSLLIDVALMTFLVPFYGTIQTTIYYDLRVRKEGLDVQMTIAEIEEGDPPPPPPPPPPRREYRPPHVPTPGSDPRFRPCPNCGHEIRTTLPRCVICGHDLQSDPSFADGRE